LLSKMLYGRKDRGKDISDGMKREVYRATE
jgi:hypothetical protein